MKKKKIADNLYTYTRDSGASYYVFRCTRNGKTVERSLGRTETMTLREAKRKVGLLLNEAIEEKDAVPTITFGDIYQKALTTIAEVRVWKSNKLSGEYSRFIENHVLDYLRDKPVASISRDDILEAIRPIWTTIPPTANLIRTLLESIFDWCIGQGYRTEANPATWRGNLSVFLPPLSKVRKIKHHEAPTVEELKLAIEQIRRNPTPANVVILFIIATASRVSQVTKAERGEIEGDVWTSPETHTKTGIAHRIPLSSLAKEALSLAQPHDTLYFPNPRGEMFENTSIRWSIKKLCPREADKPRVTVHGIRSTFRDWCAENEVPDAWAEKALGHLWGSAVTAAYYRTDMLEKRRILMQRWADMLTGDE